MPEFRSDGGTAYYNVSATADTGTDYARSEPEVAVNYQMDCGIVDAAPDDDPNPFMYIMDDFGNIKVKREARTVAQLLEEAEWTL